MEQIKELIDYYLTSRNVFGVEDCLDTIVNFTTKDNFVKIIDLIETHPEKKIETELTLYLNEIADKNFKGLEEILLKKLKSSTNKDAIEDLEGALLKLKSFNK